MFVRCTGDHFLISQVVSSQNGNIWVIHRCCDQSHLMSLTFHLCNTI